MNNGIREGIPDINEFNKVVDIDWEVSQLGKEK